MADLLIHEHKKNDAGSYDNVYRKTKAKLVETEDGGTAEQKLSDAANHIANRENPHGTTAEQVGADPSGSASQALQDAKNYTDQKIEEIPIPDVSEQINTHNTSSDAHANMGWITSDDSAPDDPVPVNADTLGGISAEDYATKVYADTAPYEKAKEQGYTGTEAEFYAALVSLKNAPFLPLSGGTLQGTVKVPEAFSLSTISGDGDELVRINGSTLSFINRNGNGGAYIYEESENEQTPVLAFLGWNGDELTILRYISDPQRSHDAANKRYVDNLVGNINTLLDTINGEVV